MTDFARLHPDLEKALKEVARFIESLSGTAPSQEELALALNRYFVKKEICDTLMAERTGADSEPSL